MLPLEDKAYTYSGTDLFSTLHSKYLWPCICKQASQVAQVAKNPPANVGDVRDVGLIAGSGRSPGGAYGTPLQYSCLENPMGGGAWQAAVHWVAKSLTRLKQLSTHIRICKQIISSVQSLCRIRLYATPWIAARQASLSITNSRSLLKLMALDSVMPSSHLIQAIKLLWS